MVTTSATSSLVTALGGGSGIDMAALAANLATAQFAARTDRLTARSELLDRQISTAGELKSQLLQLSSALGERVRSGDLSPQPRVANPAIASATRVPGSNPAGSYSLEVLALAAAQTLAAPPLSSSAAPAGSGTLTLRFGTVASGAFTPDPARSPVAITIRGGATLAEVAAAINGAGAGVSAYVASAANGARLVLKGAEGAASGFILEAVETPGEEGLAALAWNPADGDPARLLGSAGDARFKLDGLEMTSPSNSVAEPAPGFNLSLATTNAGTPTRITFSDPASAIAGFMQDFTTALNEIAATLNAAIDPQNGDLARDSGARGLRQSLSRLAGSAILPNAAASAPRTLADLGLATERDGTFRLDTARLTATLQRDPEGAAALFTTGLYGVYATVEGLARKATTLANPGSLGGSITRIAAQQGEVKEALAGIAEQQAELRARLSSRFAVADVRVGAAKSTLSFLQAQIDAWNAPRN